ncbi:MAG TPA: hypothetical protein VHC43_03510 [Mycobacteriales bacterium]|nr:hypothetical protein [Mycobacteriales bacterium]
MAGRTIRDFDVHELFAAMDSQREERGLSWPGVAREIWSMSHELNATRPNDHPISPSTLTGMPRRGVTSCQHALCMLAWLGKAPEVFLDGDGPTRSDARLPACGPDRRLRWSLKRLYGGLDDQRRRNEMTWKQLAGELGCTSNQLTGLRTARYATGIVLAMRITQWLDRPAADFIRAAKW